MTRLPSAWRRALGIALPLMLAESVDSVLWIIDAFFVGRLGSEALAALGVGGYLGWLVFVGGSLYYMGALILVAQAVGAGRRAEAGRAVGEAVTANTMLSLPIALAAWALAPRLVDVISGPRVAAEARELAVDYFHARLLGLPFLYAGLAVNAGYRGAGVTRPVLAATIVSASVNAVLDPVLIFGLAGVPRLGIVGAGLASSLASAAYLAALYALAGSLPFSVAPRPLSRLAWMETKLGLPALAERLVFVAGNLAYLGAVARCGDAALAAHTIGVRVESLAFLPIYSVGEAAAAIVGQDVGAGGVGKARRDGIEVAALNAVIGSAAALILAALAPLAPRLFTDEPGVARLAGVYLAIAAATEPLFGVAITLTMAIRGAGNTLVPTAINLTSLYVLRVVPATLLPRRMPPGLCAVGAWTAMALDMAGRAALSHIIYSRYFEKLARKLM